MDTITLTQTDLKVSRLCFGTMTFGSQVNEADSHRILDYCLENGINFIDTSNIYNNGLSERIIGKWLPQRRAEVVLATKVRGEVTGDDAVQGLSKAAMIKSCEDSLRRLQTDYVDLFYLHFPDYETPLEESLEAMDTLVKQGKVRYPAHSNYAAWQVTHMLWIAQRYGYKPALLSQPMYNLLARGIEQEYVPMAKKFGVSLIVFNPLAGGLLTGKQKRDAPIGGTRFDGNQMYLDRYWHPAQFDAVDTLRGVAENAGRSMISLALNWLLHHTDTSVIILGASRLEQLEQNVKAASEGPLTEETVAQCDEVWRNLRGITPKYNR